MICSSRTSAASLLELARDPKRLGADMRFLGVLHTWDRPPGSSPRTLHRSAGGLALMVPGDRLVAPILLPVKALSKVFCDKFCEELRELFQTGQTSVP